MLKTSRRQRGITLIEIMIGIAIALVIAAIAIGLAVAARRDAQTQDLQNQILRVDEVVQSITRGGSYEGITGTAVCNTGKLDEICGPENGGVRTMSNVFGGAIGLTSENNNLAYRMVLEGMPPSACTTIVTNLQSNFSRVRVEGTDVRAFGAAPATAATIAAACNAADGESQVLLYRGRAANPG